MKIFDSLKELEKTREFLDWRANNKDDYLVSFFYVSDKPNEIQIDYYNKIKNTITSFSYSKNYVLVVKDSKIMNKEKKELKQLFLNDVSELNDALNVASDYQKKKYPKDDVYKTIMILQNQDGIIWNIIFITQTFKVINLKFDAKSLELISDKTTPIFNFIQK
ncbi:MAG: hypothetical protein QXU20_00250 [Candidatus Woesearchaeota archaeon]